LTGIQSSRILFRTVPAAILIAIALLTSVHVFISYQIRHLLPRLVNSLSDGNYTLTYKTVNYSYIKPELLLTGIQMKPASNSLETSYTITVDTLYLGIESFIPLFLKTRELNVDKIRLVHPMIIGKRMKHPRGFLTDGELHIQVSRLQQNAIRFLNVLQVDECNLVNGHFKYYPQVQQEEQYFNIENINISIKDLFIAKPDHALKERISASIHLDLHQPHFRFPDTSFQISLNTFIWDNQQHYIEAEDFSIAQRQTQLRDSFQIRLDTLHIRKMDWSLWLDSGIVRLDTLLANNGNLFFSSNTSTKKKKADTTSLRKMKFWDAIGDLDIHHFSAKHFKAALINQLPDKERNYSLFGDTLVINDLSIRPGKLQPLLVKDLTLSVREFMDRGSGNKFKTSFSKLYFKGNTLNLYDYFISSTRFSKTGEGSSLSIPQLSLTGLSFQDIFDKKAIIREITMESPKFIIAQWSRKNEKRFSGLEEIRPFIDVERLFINHASILIKKNKARINADDVSADILAHEALMANSADALLASLRNVAISKLDLALPTYHFILQNGSIDYRNKSLRFRDVHSNIMNGRIRADLKNVAIDAMPEFKPLESRPAWQFKKVDIASGSISLLPEQKKITASSQLILRLNELNFGNIDFSYADNKTKLNANFKQIITTDAQLNEGQMLWRRAEANGTHLSLNLPGLSVNSRKFTLRSTGESVLDSADVRISKPGISAHIIAQQIISNEDFRSYDPDTLVFDRITLLRPQIMASIFDSTNQIKDSRTFLVGTKQFELKDHLIRVSVARDKDPFHFETSGKLMSGEELYLDQVNGDSRFTLKNIFSDLDSIKFIAEGNEVFRSGKIRTSLQNIVRDRRESNIMSLDIDRFSMQDIDLFRQKNGDTMQLRTKGVDIRSVKRLYLNKDSALKEAFKLPSLRIYPGNFIYRTRRSAFDIYQLDVNIEDKMLSWDSLVVLNRTPRAEFFKNSYYEKDYFTLRTGAFRADSLQPILRLKDTVAYAKKILVDSLYLKIERDKRLKDDTLSYRPLLAGMLMKIPVPVIMDSFQLTNATIWHNVIDDKTEKEGSVYFTSVNAGIKNVRNIDISDMDSISVDVENKFMDRGIMQLRYVQSYKKPDQQFSLGVRMGKLDLQELNRLILPLQNVQLEDGRINHLSMDISGNDSIAYGRIKMSYADLKVSLINKENERRSVISILANLFVRGKNNRSNLILTERLKEKSVFNYWSRISLNGFLTSIGIGKNGKKNRKFFRKLEKNNRVENLFN
jgi:hypothetical protein